LTSLRRRAPTERERWRLDALAEIDELTASPPTFTAALVLHAGQAAAVLLTALTVVICAGRRWGKSVAACFKAYVVAMATPGVTCCLIGATQGSISRIFWRTLREMNRVHGLGAVPLKGIEGWTMTLANGSQIVLLPVDSIEAADKVRGLSNVAFVCVDESQRYKADVLRYLLKDVLNAMFIDQRVKGNVAQLWLMGTPNPLGKLGTFYDYMNRDGAVVVEGSVYDNTKLGTREQIERVVDEMLAEAGETREGAWYQREILAKWVVDLARRVYVFDDDDNTYDVLPVCTTFAFIGDIGVRDADAVGVWGWRDGDPTLYLVREVIKRGQDTLALADELRALLEEFQPIVCAFDGGGLGLKVILTLQKLFPDVPIRAVNKPPVNLQVKALNDRAARGLRVSKTSTFYAEVRNSEWVNGVVNGKIQETGHSDVVPMARYAAVELAQLLPDAPVDETADEKYKRERHENAQRAERNRRADKAIDEVYEVDEFAEDPESDMGAGG
jgi:hypothetical protein